MNRDQDNIICQVQDNGSLEGGDSANWMGHWIYLTGEKFPFVRKFEVGFGGYVRHPNPLQSNNGFGAYYKDPWNGCISRDQMTGILMALIAQRQRGAMIRLILNHACRGFLFSYNTIRNGVPPKMARWKVPDITFFDILSMELRGFGKFSKVFWPLLCVLDLHLLGSAIWDEHFDNQEPDVISFVGKLMVAAEHTPTPVSRLALKFVNKENLLSRLTEYWCGWRENPEFVPEFEKKLNQILK